MIHWPVTMADNDNLSDAKEKEKRVEEYLKQGEECLAKGDYNKALEAFITGLKLSETCEGSPYRMAFYKNMGNIYLSFGDNERAINLYKTGYSMREEYPDKKTECDILFNLTGGYYYSDDAANARLYNEMAKKLIQPGDSVKGFMAVYNDGLILTIEEKYDEAIEKFREAAKIAPNKTYLCHALEKIYINFMRKEERDSVIEYLPVCNRLALENGMTDMYVQTLGDLANFYETSDPAKSAFYHNRHSQISDSIMQSAYNLYEFYRLRNIQYLYELEKTERKISELQLKKKMKDREVAMQRRITYSLVAALAIFIALLILLARQKKKLRNSYKDLFDINQSTMSQFSNMQQQCERYREQIERLEHERDDSREYDGNDNSERQDCKYRSSSLDNDKKRGILVRIEQTMEKDKAFCDPNFSLSRLSEIVESNQTYVSQIINETYGKNFSDFLNDYRTREACERLLDTENYGNYTISGIAADVGYKAQSTFIRAFKKSTGLQPSVYQKMARQSKLE